VRWSRRVPALEYVYTGRLQRHYREEVAVATIRETAEKGALNPEVPGPEIEGSSVAPREAFVEAPQADEAGGIGLFFGRVACAFGLATAALGTISMEVAIESVALVLGIVGYALGARALGVATIVISTLMMFVTLAVGVGEIPGIAPTDPVVIPNS
jgi:hypothetical protein